MKHIVFKRIGLCLVTTVFFLRCADQPAEPSETAVELIEHGSFESPLIKSFGLPDYQEYSMRTDQPDGWTVEKVDYVHANRWPAASEVQSVDLNALEPGYVARRVKTQRGKKYVLSFSYATNPGNVFPSSPETRVFRVLWNQIPVDTLEVVRTNAIDWKRHSMVLRAEGNDSLRFESLTGGSAGAALDSVSLIGPSP